MQTYLERNARVISTDTRDITRPIFELDRLIAGVTAGNRHAEIGSGAAVGKEVLV